MKKQEKDYEYLETPPEILQRGFRRITRPKRLDAVLEKSRSAKSRVTIYFDADIIDRFKERGKSEGIGYQTLMNEALRKVIDGTSAEDLKQGLLKDKKFLEQLKTALAA